MSKYRDIVGLAAAGMAFTLSGCGEEAEVAEAESADCVAGVEVADGWLALPAVPGDPAAAYFTIMNNSERDLTIRSGEVAGGGSGVLHQVGEWNLEPSMDEIMQVSLPAGETAEFEPAGLHVMVMQPDTSWQPGGEGELTLTFVGGDTCRFPISYRAAGDMPESEDGVDAAE